MIDLAGGIEHSSRRLYAVSRMCTFTDVMSPTHPVPAGGEGSERYRSNPAPGGREIHVVHSSVCACVTARKGALQGVNPHLPSDDPKAPLKQPPFLPSNNPFPPTHVSGQHAMGRRGVSTEEIQKNELYFLRVIVPAPHLQRRRLQRRACLRARHPTAIKKSRIVRLGFRTS
jgi:hypothetical protein